MSIHFDSLPKDPWHRKVLADHLSELRRNKHMRNEEAKNRWLAFCRGMTQAFWYAEHRRALTGKDL